MQRPASVTVFGVLNIVFGVLGLFGLAFSVLVLFAFDIQPQPMNPPRRSRTPFGIPG